MKMQSKIKKPISEVVKASESYLKKEEIRQTLQNVVIEKIRSKSVKNQKDLDDLISTFEMSIRALKMVPYDIFVELSHDKSEQ